MNALYTVRVFALLALAAGVVGMVICLPFLFSARIEDLVGAGFPFVGGAVLAGAGLISLALTLRAAPDAASHRTPQP